MRAPKIEPNYTKSGLDSEKEVTVIFKMTITLIKENKKAAGEVA
jgi:hypothetical protein